MSQRGTLLLNRHDVGKLLSLDECITAVENAFKLHGAGQLVPPGLLSIYAADGGFHIKAALLPRYFVAKLNGNFFQNQRRHQLPNIQGLIVLCDARNGYPLMVMDSIEITILRTGAATAVAAKHLARSDSRVATICGCGNQGRIQLRSLTRVLQLETAFALDLDQARARQFAEELSKELNLEIIPTLDLMDAVSRSDVCVTCTPSRQYFLKREHVCRGLFIAAVGADSPDKQELEPEILASSKVVTDILAQCAEIGELNHALRLGVICRDDVYAELGEIVAGQKPGRTSNEEIIVFDSTGTALQDAAAATIVYEQAVRLGRETTIDFAA